MSFRRYLLCVPLCLFGGLVFAQTGLQGFDRNYPGTPAGDNPRGFTPQVAPVARPAPPPPTTVAPARTQVGQDPFTAPDPMIDGTADGANNADDEPDDGS